MSKTESWKRRLRKIRGRPEAVRALRHLSQRLAPPVTRSGAPGLSLIRGGSVLVEAPSFEGVFELDARSHLLSRLVTSGDFEPECARAIRAHVKPGADVIDVGANVGFYSVLLGRLVGPRGRVLSLEPTQAAYSHLLENLERNDVKSQTTAVRAALGARTGLITLEVVPGREEYSSLALSHRSVRGQHRSQESVPQMTLDDLVSEHALEPSFIKIDVEGSEAAVLAGGLKTLERFRPTLLAEMMPDLLAAQGATVEQLEELLVGLGYELDWVSGAEVLCVAR